MWNGTETFKQKRKAMKVETLQRFPTEQPRKWEIPVYGKYRTFRFSVAVMATFVQAQRALSNLCERGPTQPILLHNLAMPLSFPLTEPRSLGLGTSVCRSGATVSRSHPPLLYPYMYRIWSVSVSGIIYFHIHFWAFCIPFRFHENYEPNVAALGSVYFCFIFIPTPTTPSIYLALCVTFSCLICHTNPKINIAVYVGPSCSATSTHSTTTRHCGTANPQNTPNVHSS